MNRFLLTCVCAVAVSLVATGTMADTLFSYDFDSQGLTVGSSLGGQDGWVNPFAGTNTPKVVNAVGNGGNTTNAAGTNSSASGTSYYVQKSISVAFTSADTNVAFDAWICPCTTTAKESVSTFWEFGSLSNSFAMGWAQIGTTNSKSYLRTATGENNGSITSLTAKDWYDCKVVVDFSVTGGKVVSFSLQDMTTGAAPVYDPALAGINLGLTSTGGVYTATMVLPRFDHNTSGVSAFDNPSISTAVPEPGTLALLCCGLAGLLCYAWRNRK
ncbi:MAG: PEP-CTERM sorting domain-containing protein [Thermoguttaceae bacterium]